LETFKQRAAAWHREPLRDSTSSDSFREGRIAAPGGNGGAANSSEGRLVSACHWLSGTRRQTHVNDEVQTLTDLSVKILRARVVLSDVHSRIFGKTGTLQQCSRALSSAIGFVWCRHLTAFILHHWRPVGVEYSLHQLGESLPQHLGRGRRLNSPVLLSAPLRWEVENQSGLV